MIIQTGHIDKALGVHLQRIYKTQATGAAERASRRDVVSISALSALVEHGRACAAALPEVRADRVELARAALRDGIEPDGGSIASAMINHAVEGQV